VATASTLIGRTGAPLKRHLGQQTLEVLARSGSQARAAMHLPTEVPQLHPARPPPGSPGVEGVGEQADDNWLN
jgi:hypothetical protein